MFNHLFYIIFIILRRIRDMYNINLRIRYVNTNIIDDINSLGNEQQIIGIEKDPNTEDWDDEVVSFLLEDKLDYSIRKKTLKQIK